MVCDSENVVPQRIDLDIAGIQAIYIVTLFSLLVIIQNGRISLP